MVYLVNNNGVLETFYSKLDFDKKYSNRELYGVLEVSDEEYNRCGNAAYIFNNAIMLGENPVILIKKQIRQYRQFLEDTDYIDNKIIEGDATANDYADVIAKRKEARRAINDLSEQLNS